MRSREEEVVNAYTHLLWSILGVLVYGIVIFSQAYNTFDKISLLIMIGMSSWAFFSSFLYHTQISEKKRARNVGWNLIPAPTCLWQGLAPRSPRLASLGEVLGGNAGHLLALVITPIPLLSPPPPASCFSRGRKGPRLFRVDEAARVFVNHVCGTFS